MANAAILAQTYQNAMWMQCWDDLALGRSGGLSWVVSGDYFSRFVEVPPGWR